MKKTTPALLFALLTGLFVSNTSFAYPNNHAVQQECQQAIQQLTSLINAMPKDNKCLGDVAVVVTYIESAKLKLHYKEYNLALTEMKYAQTELQEIIKRPWCTYMAARVHPVMSTTTFITEEMELLAHVENT